MSKKKNKYVIRRFYGPTHKPWCVFLFDDLPKRNQQSGGLVRDGEAKPIYCGQNKEGAARIRNIYNGPEIDLKIYKVKKAIYDVDDEIADTLYEISEHEDAIEDLEHELIEPRRKLEPLYEQLRRLEEEKEETR